MNCRLKVSSVVVRPLPSSAAIGCRRRRLSCRLNGLEGGDSGILVAALVAEQTVVLPCYDVFVAPLQRLTTHRARHALVVDESPIPRPEEAVVLLDAFRTHFADTPEVVVVLEADQEAIDGIELVVEVGVYGQSAHLALEAVLVEVSSVALIHTVVEDVLTADAAHVRHRERTVI